MNPPASPAAAEAAESRLGDAAVTIGNPAAAIGGGGMVQGAAAAPEQLTSVVHDPPADQEDANGQAAPANAYVDMAAASASAYGIPASGGVVAVDPAYAVTQAHAFASLGGEIDAAAHLAQSAAAGHSIAAAARATSPTATGASDTLDAQAHAPQEMWTNQSITSRQAMDLLLAQQKQAMLNVGDAEKELARAKEKLAEAKHRKDAVDGLVMARSTTLVDDLLAEPTRWNEMYRRLMEFKAENGHCHVMRNPASNKKLATAPQKGSRETNDQQSLGNWVGQCRLEARRPVGHPDRLEPYKIKALDRLGFDWEPRGNYWTEMYGQLQTYLEQNGGKMPPRFKNNVKFPLGQWCDTQLDNYRKFQSGRKGAYINQEKIDMLTSIGFIWDKRGQLWRDNYERLKEFRAQHGHCNATAKNNGGDKAFGTWVAKQKRKYTSWRSGVTKSLEFSLSDEQAALMDAIGFAECAEADGRKQRCRSPSTGEPPRKDVRTDPGADPSAVANAWGASANAVSMLVDAIMTKESRGTTAGNELDTTGV
ncbi:hypothetical protein ACHAXT_010369 [Thalassiosira profunda]